MCVTLSAAAVRFAVVLHADAPRTFLPLRTMTMSRLAGRCNGAARRERVAIPLKTIRSALFDIRLSKIASTIRISILNTLAASSTRAQCGG